MRFLVDAQLPPALARYLSASMGVDATHVLDLGLLTATDSAIWQFALEHQYVVITKDDDFQVRAALSTTQPAIIWVRIGNCSKKKLLDVFAQHWPTIQAELSCGTLLVEIA